MNLGSHQVNVLTRRQRNITCVPACKRFGKDIDRVRRREHWIEGGRSSQKLYAVSNDLHIGSGVRRRGLTEYRTPSGEHYCVLARRDNGGGRGVRSAEKGVLYIDNQLATTD